MDGRDEWPRIIRLVCSVLMKFGKSSNTRRSKNIDIAICIRVRDLIELADIKRRFICVMSMSNKDGDF